MDLKVNGVSIDKALKHNPGLDRVIALLNKLPKNELLTSAELAKKLKIDSGSVLNYCKKGNNALKDNTEVFGKYRLWGSKIAIKALRAKMRGA